MVGTNISLFSGDWFMEVFLSTVSSMVSIDVPPFVMICLMEVFLTAVSSMVIIDVPLL